VSQENVDLLRRLNDGMSRGEMNEMDFRSFFHPDVEFVPLRAATEGAYHGISGIERFVTDTDETFEKFEPHFEYLDLRERVLVWGTIHVGARQSGIDTDIPVGAVVEFRDGKVVRLQAFDSKKNAFKAVGLEE
jgi:hypothetical protein